MWKSSAFWTIVMVVFAAREVTAQQADSTQAAHQLGQGFLEQRKYSTAIEWSSRAIRLRPNFACAYVTRGRAYMGANNLSAAIGDFSVVIGLPNGRCAQCLSNAYYYRGWAYWYNGMPAEAQADWNMAARYGKQVPVFP